MAGCGDISGGRALSEHLQNWITGNEVDEKKNGRDDQPDDWQGVSSSG